MDEIKIIPQSANTFIIANGDIRIEVYCTDNYISIKNPYGKIIYPEIIMGDITDERSVRFL